jgi:hypothetical protein
MTPRLRKFALTAHVICSVGWLGGVAASLALVVAGLTSQEAPVVRAAYLTMELTGWFVLLPFSIASLITGLVQALGTTWGLFRHYWIVAKLLINVSATIVLVMYMQTLSYLAGVAAETTMPNGDLGGLRSPSVVVHAAAALLLLVVATTLSVYKPRGMTRYGRRTQHARRGGAATGERVRSQPYTEERALSPPHMQGVMFGLDRATLP